MRHFIGYIVDIFCSAGKMQDDQTLREQKVIKGSKIMLIGSTVSDVMAVSPPDAETMKEIEKQAADTGKVPICKQKVCTGVFLFVLLL